jgi:hypothetical protein
MRHQLLGFRAAEKGYGELQQVNLHVRMLPLRDITSTVDHGRYEAIGGSFHGEFASVATSKQGYDEIKEAYAEEREASREVAGNQLGWLQLAGQYQARLGTFAAEEVCPLECSMRDREHNFDVLGRLATIRGEALRRRQSAMAEAEDTEEEAEEVEEAVPTPDAVGSAQAGAAGSERSVDAAGDKAALPGGTPIDVDNSQPSQQQRQHQPRQQQPPPEPRRRTSKGQLPRQSQPLSDAALVPNVALCFALVQKGGVWQQCTQYPRKGVSYPDGAPFEYCHLHSFDDGKNFHRKCKRSLDDELSEADDCVEDVPEQAGAAQEKVELDCGTITSVGNVYVARRAKTGQEKEFSVKEHGADAQSEAQMWLLCFNDGPQELKEPAEGSAGASGQLQDQAGEPAEPKRKVPRTG